MASLPFEYAVDVLWPVYHLDAYAGYRHLVPRFPLFFSSLNYYLGAVLPVHGGILAAFAVTIHLGLKSLFARSADRIAISDATTPYLAGSIFAADAPLTANLLYSLRTRSTLGTHPMDLAFTVFSRPHPRSGIPGARQDFGVRMKSQIYYAVFLKKPVQLSYFRVTQRRFHDCTQASMQV